MEDLLLLFLVYLDNFYGLQSPSARDWPDTNNRLLIKESILGKSVISPWLQSHLSRHSDLTGGYLGSQSVLHQGWSLARGSWRWLEVSEVWVSHWEAPGCPETGDQSPPGQGSYWHHPRPGWLRSGGPADTGLVRERLTELWIVNIKLTSSQIFPECGTPGPALLSHAINTQVEGPKVPWTFHSVSMAWGVCSTFFPFKPMNYNTPRGSFCAFWCVVKWSIVPA